MGQGCSSLPCCAERKDPPKPEDPNAGRTFPAPAQASNSDAEKFDVAFETEDVKQFVALMDSREPIEAFAERMHPWAMDPCTVGALAGTQLSILSSMATDENPWRKEEIRAAGALPKFKAFLQSDEDDRVQTSVVAMSFLSTDNAKCAKEMLDMGCLPLLVPHLSSEIQGMRAAAASSCRNIYVQSNQARQAFVQAGGVQPLVGMLLLDQGNADLMLEIILNLEDFVETDEGVDPTLAKLVLDAGAAPHLKTVDKLDDEELTQQAQDLIQKLHAH